MCHHYPGQKRREADGQLSIEFAEMKITPDFSLWTEPVECYPLSNVATLRLDNDDNWLLEDRCWGFLPRAWKPTATVSSHRSFQRGKFNARSETIDSVWPWKLSWHQRCVLLAHGFCEPGIDGGEVLYSLPDYPVIAMAGLWETCEINGETIESCVMLTTAANALVQATRKGPRMRQPVIFTNPASIQRYCSPEFRDLSDICDLFSPVDASAMSHRLSVPRPGRLF